MEVHKFYNIKVDYGNTEIQKKYWYYGNTELYNMEVHKLYNIEIDYGNSETQKQYWYCGNTELYNIDARLFTSCLSHSSTKRAQCC